MDIDTIEYGKPIVEDLSNPEIRFELRKINLIENFFKYLEKNPGKISVPYTRVYEKRRYIKICQYTSEILIFEDLTKAFDYFVIALNERITSQGWDGVPVESVEIYDLFWAHMWCPEECARDGIMISIGFTKRPRRPTVESMVLKTI